MINYQGEMILKPPANFKDLEPDAKAKTKEKISGSVLLYLYEKQVANEIPLLDQTMRFNHGQTRRDPIQSVEGTWKGDILPFRESLIRIER